MSLWARCFVLPAWALLSIIPRNVLGEEQAEAFLYEAQSYRDKVDPGGSFTRTIDGRVFLRTAAAVQAFGQLQFPYLVGYGEVVFENVVMAKPDGRQVEVKGALVEDLNPFGASVGPLTADMHFKKLTIPGLEPGDRLSYRVVQHQKPLTPGATFAELRMPYLAGDPVQTYELDLPRENTLRLRVRPGLGASWDDVPSGADRVVRRLRVKVPRPDPNAKVTKKLLAEWSDPDVIFTSFATWSDVTRWWWDLARDRLAPDAAVRRQAGELCPPTLSPREKLEALHQFVASKVRYLNVGFGIGRMQPHAAADVLSARYGDCKDKHALLAALASSVGLDVRPVLVSTSRSDLHDDVPAPQQFDHMISVARIGPDPSSWIWLDGTERLGPLGYLGPLIRGKRALLVEPTGEGRVVTTPEDPPFLSRTSAEFKGTLRPDGVLSGRTVIRSRSDLELYLRAAFEALPAPQRLEAVKKSLASHWTDAKIEDLVVSDPADTREPLRIEFSAEKTVQDDPSRSDWSLWIPLPDFALADAPEDVTPDSEKLEIGVRETVARAEIELPDGWTARPPLSVVMERPFGKFESTYSVEGHRLVATRAVRLSRSSIAPAEFKLFAALRKTASTDRDQKFLVSGTVAASAAPSAEALRKQGNAAREKNDSAEAVRLLTKSSEADPKLKNVFYDLGRALHAAGRYEDAVKAYTRQIELEPFHDDAYQWRSASLTQLGRMDESFRDLRKAMEITPFAVWPYETLAGHLRSFGQHREAAELYARAAAIEQDKPGRWIDLAWEYARSGQAEEARQALGRARTLKPPDWMKISAAGAYGLIGDHAVAAELAAEGLEPMASRLAERSPDSFDDGDAWTAEYLARAWEVIGSAAMAAGEDAKAERYLTAAWRLYFLPKAGWALGELREKQGRLADALDLWALANTVPTAPLNLPPDRQKRMDALAAKLPPARKPSLSPSLPPDVRAALERNPAQANSGGRMTELRSLKLADVRGAALAEEVVVVFSRDGRIERLVAASAKQKERVAKAGAGLGNTKLPFTAPDERPFRAARKALFVCSGSTPCGLVLDLEGLPKIGR